MGFPEWGSRTLRTLGVLGGLLSPHASGLGNGEWLEGGGAPRWVPDSKGHVMSDLDFLFSLKYKKLYADVSICCKPHQFPGPADSDSPVFFSLCQRCSWTPVGLGAQRLPARRCASSRRWGYTPPSWSSAKPVTRSSALPAKPAGTLARVAQRPCPSPSFPGRPGTFQCVFPGHLVLMNETEPVELVHASQCKGLKLRKTPRV